MTALTAQQQEMLNNALGMIGYEANIAGIIAGLQNSAGVDVTTITGDVTINSSKVSAIGSSKVTNAKIAANAVDYSKLDTATSQFYIKERLPADGAAGTDSEKSILVNGIGSFKVISMGFIPDSAITGTSTDYASLALIDKSTDGSGTTSVVSKDFKAAGNAFVNVDFGTVGATNQSIASGHVITVKRTHSGNGQILPAGSIVIVAQRTA